MISDRKCSKKMRKPEKLQKFWEKFFRVLSVGNLKKCFVITIFQMQKENVIYNTLEEKKCSMKTAGLKKIDQYDRISNSNYKDVFFFKRRIFFCGRVFSKTTLDSIIQPDAIWKRRVQSVLLTGSGFPVRLRTGSRPENILD